MKCASCITAQLHRLSLTVTFCFLGIFSVIGCSITCKSTLQVSLDQNGEALLTPSIFLSNANDCTGPFVLTLTANGSVVTDNTLECSQVGQNIVAQVTDSDTQVSCWSTISVIDFNTPRFTNCVDVFVPCSTIGTIAEIANVSIKDNCNSNPTVTFTDTENTFNCDLYSKIVTRTWRAVDSDGNQAPPCVQNIHFEEVSLADVTIPDNFSFSGCADPDISPEATGFPMANGNSISGAHCGLLINHTDQVIPSCGSTFKIFRHWTVTDWCGSPTLSGTQSIELLDTLAPIIVCPTDTIIFGTNSLQFCTGDASDLSLDFSDDCGTATIDYQWTFGHNASNVPVGLYDINAVATDPCGNQSECLFFIQIKDTTEPVALCDSDFSVTLSQAGSRTISAIDFDNGSTDNCGITERLIAVDTNFVSQLEVTCEDIGNTLEIILMVMDACGNSNMCSSNVTIKDNTLPTISCPANITLFCSDDVTDLSLAGSATASDNCFDYNPWFTDENNLSACNTGTIIRTWRVFERDIEVRCNQIITLSTFLPSITYPQDVTVSCGAFAGEPIVEFECDGLFIGANSNPAINSDNPCHVVTTKTWKVFDTCSGDFWERDQIVTEIDDVPPVITVEAQNMTVDCQMGDTSAALLDWLANNGNAVATDCTSLTWSNTLLSTESICAGSEKSTYLFTVADQCGNSSTTTAIFAKEDIVAPQFLIPPPDTTFSCNVKDINLLNAYFGSGAASTFVDNCSAVNVDFTFDNSGDNFCGNFPVTIFLTDDCGNSNASTFMLTIIDEEAPVVTEEAKDLFLDCAANIDAEIAAWLAINGDANAVDRCVDVQWSNDFNTSERLICGSGQGLPVTFFAMDACGNSTPTTANIFINDNEAPRFLTTPQDLDLDCVDNIQQLIDAYLANGNGATFVDNCGTPILSGGIEGELSLGCTPTIVTFTLVDNCNNSVTATTSLTVRDIANPIITQPAQDLMIQCTDGDAQSSLQAWLDANGNAEAFDACTDLTWSATLISSETMCGGNEMETYQFTAVDACDNSSSTTATFSSEDNVAPQFLIPPPDTTFSCNVKDINLLSAYFESGAASTFTDNCSAVDVSFVFENEREEFCGEFPVTIILTDECGNTTSSDFALTIIDEEAPNISEEAKDLNLACDADIDAEIAAWLAINGNASAFDRCVDVEWSNDFDTVGDLICGSDEGFPVTFFAMDACGNSTPTTANIFITDDEAPQFTIAPQDLTIICSGDLQEQLDAYLVNGNGATFTDNCGTPTLTGVIDGELSIGCTAANVTFTLVDACNNSVTANTRLTIDDTTPPVITQEPINELVTCQENDIETSIQIWLAANGNAIANDDCGTVVWTNNYDGQIPACDGISQSAVIFTATDMCGNSIEVTGLFMIDDSTPPTITVDAMDQMVECNGSGNDAAFQDWLMSNGNAAATDACSGVVWSNDFMGVTDSICGGSSDATVNFMATDICGNTATTTATFTIVDTTGPVFLGLPFEFMTECDGTGNTFEFDFWTSNFGGGFAIDSCGTAEFSFEVLSENNDCTDGVSTRTSVLFTATDECGNTNSATADFVVRDSTEPFISCPNDIQEADLNTDCINDVAIDVATASDFCSENLTITIDLDYFQDDVVDVTLDGPNASGIYPVGVHTVIYKATDECGNVGTCEQIIDIIDIVSPQIECNEFIIYLDENGEYFVDTDILGSASDNCSAVDVTPSIDTVTCANQPVVNLGLSAQDSYGNLSNCMKVYAVLDTFNTCESSLSDQNRIAGNLYREDLEMLENATVNLTDGMDNTITSNDNGQYNFNVNPGYNYTITPYKNDDPKNGVTTIDLIKLQQHILGASPIVSPYQLIAADANNSGGITTLDLVEIQQMILDVIPEFTNNTSWRFVDESFVFPNPANPFASYFPETTSFNNLSGVNVNNDFIAIKIGDINESALTHNKGTSTANRNSEIAYLLAENKTVAKDEVVDIPFMFNLQQNIDGYQLQLQYDTDAFEFVAITDLQLPNLTINNFGLNNLKNGTINANWINVNQHQIQAAESIFTIRLRAKVTSNLKDLITVDPLLTYNEIYKKNEDGALYGAPLHLSFEDITAIPNTGKDQVFLYQNTPNPFEDRTTIQFSLPQLTKSTVSIFDATGRLVWQISKEFPAGENSLTIESRDLGLEGMYIYTLDTDYGREVKKMILLSQF